MLDMQMDELDFKNKRAKELEQQLKLKRTRHFRAKPKEIVLKTPFTGNKAVKLKSVKSSKETFSSIDGAIPNEQTDNLKNSMASWSNMLNNKDL